MSKIKINQTNLAKNVLLNYALIKANTEYLEEEIKEIEKYEGKISVSYEEKIGLTYKINKPVEDLAIEKIEQIKEIQERIEANKRALKKIEIAMKTLEEIEREIIEKRFIEKKQWKTISDEMNISESNVRCKTYKALDKIGEVMTK